MFLHQKTCPFSPSSLKKEEAILIKNNIKYGSKMKALCYLLA